MKIYVCYIHKIFKGPIFTYTLVRKARKKCGGTCSIIQKKKYGGSCSIRVKNQIFGRTLFPYYRVLKVQLRVLTLYKVFLLHLI